MIIKKLNMSAGVVFASMLGALLGSSAQAEDGQAVDDSGVIEEILVTARKREESFVDVPSSLSVVGSEQLEAYGTHNLADLADSVPNLYVGTSNGVPQVSVRGLGTAAINTFFDYAVGLSVDGLSYQRPESFELGYFDTQRVEVLRGPQGSFFGRNTTAGLINVISKGPSEEFEGSISAGFEDVTDEQLYKLTLSGPLAPTLGARLALQQRDSDGWVESTRSPLWDRDQAGIEETMGRLTLDWSPSDNVTVSSKTAFVDFYFNGSANQLVGCGPSLQGYMAFAQLLGAIQNIDDCTADENRTGAAGVAGGVNGGGSDEREVEGWTQSLTIDWSIGDYVFTSVTGYQDFEADARIPASWFEARTTSASTISEWDDFSQEFRLLSPTFDWGSFVVGAFYNSANTKSAQGVDFDFPVLSLGLLPFASSAWKPLDLDQESIAVFGEVIWLLSEDWSLTLGGRYTRDEKDMRLSQTLGPLGVRDNPADPAVSTPFVGLTALTGWTPFDIQDDDTFSDFTPSVTLEWNFSNNGNAYLSYKEGFKSGGFDQGVSFQGPGGPNDAPTGFEYDQENVEAIELGVKLELPEQSMLLSAAIFHQEFTDLQVQGFDPSDLLAANLITRNAADSTSEGVELELLWQATESLRINASLAYLDAKYDSYPDAPCYNFQTPAEGCSAVTNTQNLTDENLILAPEEHAAVGFVYYAPLGDSGLELEIGGDFSYRSEVNLSNNFQPGSVSESLTMINATVALKGRDDRWEVRLIGRNLGDEDVLANHATSAFPDSFIGSIIMPRRVAAQLTVNF